uniref:Dynamin N-terminal domain-containing protein n=1 Tax=Desulfobacca acetoxidans TaxID=60893 RepID=A0A7C5ENM7_9BACT
MSASHRLPPIPLAIKQLGDLAREWQGLFPQAASQADHWLKVLAQIEAHLAEDCLRLPVVGTVKSGKSTLINALLGQDLLRRGAGILTAMITRVQSGPGPKAVLRFKEWQEITGEIGRALALFPGGTLTFRSHPLDLRRREDRELVAQALQEGEQTALWSGGSLNQEWLLLKSYLEGYDQVADLLSSGELSLAGEHLARHGDLVTRESTAVYLKDVLLTTPIPGLPGALELGDCQGSDSPIPQHLARVLTYLLKADLVLYVISSRVGLRQGDFQFLNEIKRMGLLPHTWFLLNLDLAEHRGLGDVEALKTRIHKELVTLLPNPVLFAFSALELLFRRRRERDGTLEPRETALLQVWESDQETLAFSREEARRFLETLALEVDRLRHRRLAGGSLSQVLMVARGLREQVELAQGLLGKDLQALQTLETGLEERRHSLEALSRSLTQALNGTRDHLKGAFRKRVGSFLDTRSGQGAALTDFILEYEPRWEDLIPQGHGEPLRPTLYRLFQEFHKALTRFAAEEMTGRILEFVRQQEEWLRQELLATAGPLFLSLKEGLNLYYQELAAQGLPATPPTLKLELPPASLLLEVPLLTVAPEVDWRFSGEAWLRSGMGWLRRLWEAIKGRLGRKAVTEPGEQLLLILKGALTVMKDRLLEEVRINLLDFGERLKFQYFFPLVDNLASNLEAHLDNLLKSLLADLKAMAVSLRQAGTDQETRRLALTDLARKAAAVEQSLAAETD